MDEFIVNGITYSINLANRKLLWKEKELNYETEIIRATRDWSINKAIAEYRTNRNNSDLLTAAGVQDVPGNLHSEVIIDKAGKAEFVPDDANASDLTVIDLKKWFNIISFRINGYVPYDADNNYDLFPQN